MTFFRMRIMNFEFVQKENQSKPRMKGTINFTLLILASLAPPTHEAPLIYSLATALPFDLPVAVPRVDRQVHISLEVP